MIRAATAQTCVRAKPAEQADVVCALAPGEEFAVLDIVGDWAWGYRRADHLVGYVLAGCIAL